MSAQLCTICRDVVRHPFDHKDACCDCFDISLGMPLEDINVERAARGAAPLEKPSPPCREGCARCARALPALGVWAYNNWRSFGGKCEP